MEGSRQKQYKVAGSGEGLLHEERICWRHCGLLRRKRRRRVSLLGGRIGEALARTRGTRKGGAPEAIVCFRSSYEEQNRALRSKSVSENDVRTGGWEIVHFVRPRTKV